MPIVSKS